MGRVVVARGLHGTYTYYYLCPFFGFIAAKINVNTFDKILLGALQNGNQTKISLTLPFATHASQSCITLS
jgi:hypothetical protein